MSRSPTTARAEDWIGYGLAVCSIVVPVVLLMMLQAAGATVWASERIAPDSPSPSPQEEGLQAIKGLAWICGGMVLAAVLFFLLASLRRRSNRAYVQGVIRGTRAVNGGWVASSWPLLQWTVLLGVLSLAMLPLGEGMAAESESSPDDPSLTLMGLYAGAHFIAVTAFFMARARRRERVAPLLEANILARQPSAAELRQKDLAGRSWVGRQYETFRLGVRIAGIMVITQLIFFVPGWVARVLDDGISSTGAYAADFALVAVVVPGVTALVVLGVFACFPPLWWMVRECVTNRVSVVGLVLFIGTGIASEFGTLNTWMSLLAGVGLIIVSGTMLKVMDLGAQPWVGLFAIAAGFVVGLIVYEDGSSGPVRMPDGVLAWLSVVIAAGYTLWQLKQHWRTYFPPLLRVGPPETMRLPLGLSEPAGRAFTDP